MVEVGVWMVEVGKIMAGGWSNDVSLRLEKVRSLEKKGR